MHDFSANISKITQIANNQKNTFTGLLKQKSDFFRKMKKFTTFRYNTRMTILEYLLIFYLY
jgi:hypothetical protein